MCAKLLHSCLTLCNPMDYSLPASSVYWDSPASLLEWVTMPFSRVSSPPRDQTSISYDSRIGRKVLYHQHLLGGESESEVIQLCLTLPPQGTVTYQAPLSMGFSRQECWSGLPFASLEDRPDPGTKPGSPALQAVALPSEPPGKAPGGSCG